MRDVTDDIKALRRRLAEAEHYLKVDELRARQPQLETEASRPDLWDDQERARKVTSELTQVNDEAFLADDTLIGGYELHGGWVRVERIKIGKRAFVGNSGMAAPGRKVPKASLVAVLSAAPRRKKAHAGESYLGSPPAPLRRTAEKSDAGRTYRPPVRLRLFRALIELCRLVPATELSIEPRSSRWR